MKAISHIINRSHVGPQFAKPLANSRFLRNSIVHWINRKVGKGSEAEIQIDPLPNLPWS